MKQNHILSISQVVDQIKSSLRLNFTKISELSCVIFSNYLNKIKHHPIKGSTVLALGDFSIYSPRGQLQFQIKDLFLSGDGNLWLAYEKLKNELEKEGLFDISLKKPIPKYPLKILGNGNLTVKLLVQAASFTASAKTKIESVGGTREILDSN